MFLTELIPESEFTVRPQKDPEVNAVCSDTRTVRQGDLFILIRGSHFNAENCLPVLLSKKPSAIVSEEPISGGDIPVYTVHSARRALAYAKYNECGLKPSDFTLIGVTGTNGKTTTATMLKKILEIQGKTGFIGTGKILAGDEILTDFGYSMTTPDPEILYPALKTMKERGIRQIVMEVSSHALAQDKVAPLFFSAAVFTNLSPEHLDYHRSMEDYFAAKCKLFHKCKTAVLNADDRYSERIASETSAKVLRVGAVYDAEISARNIENLSDGSRFLYHAPRLSFLVNCRLPGIYNVSNAALALTVGIALGVKPCEAKVALESIGSVEGRLERVSDSPKIYVDYAHTEMALQNVLKTLSSGNTHGKIITVFGCGGNRDSEKRPKMAKTAEEYSDYTIVTSDNSREEPTATILKDILSGFEKKETHTVISDRSSAIEAAVEMAGADDTVLIAGKGHEKYIIDKSGVHFYDEKAVIKEALRKKENRRK